MNQRRENYIDLSKELTPAFYKEKLIKKGSVLTFEGKDGRQDFKIVRLNRSKRICLVEPTKLYTEDEINAMPREQAEEIIEGGSNV